MITVCYCQVSGEYHARLASRVVGSCYFLREHNGGCWKWEVKGGVAGIEYDRETALQLLHRECVRKHDKEGGFKKA